MDENRERSSYVALVAALREEFSPGGLAAMTLLLRRYRHGVVYGSLGTLTEAVFDAYDVGFEVRSCGRSQDGTLHCRPANACDDCPLNDLVHDQGVKP